MKKLLVSSLALITAVALTACDGNDDGQAGPPPIEAGQQNLGNSAALCISRGWQGQPEMRRFNWNGNREDSFEVLGNQGQSRTSVRWSLTPASRGHGNSDRAEGQLVVLQGRSQVSVRSALGGFVNLSVSTGNYQSDIDLHCLSNTAFRRESGDLNRVVCRYRLDAEGDRSRSREEVIYWNGRPQARELVRGRDGEFVVLRINGNGRLEIEARNLDNRKVVKAEALINEGLELRYRGRSSSSDLMVSCGAASK
jgi:hypothetical protein